jgi:endonuclease/exonuclease/phosphatase family metal-dependent hydrolase
VFEPVAAAGHRISVATYNIHRCIGRGRGPDLGRTLDVIEDLDADIIALQEVETPAAPSAAAIVLLRRLADLGYEPVLGPTMRGHRHSYGNVLLSRLPVRRRRRIDLSQPGREPRGLIDVRLELRQPHQRGGRGATLPMLERVMTRLAGAGQARSPAPGRVPTGRGRAVHLRCLATHLGLRAGERRAQIAAIAERLDLAGREAAVRLDWNSGAAGRLPLVLLGDFNEWRPGGRRLGPIHARAEAAPALGTWPAPVPLLALDRIWYRGGLRLTDLEVIRTPLARAASDHLPLRARLWLPEA